LLAAPASLWVLADVANTCAEGFSAELCARCAPGWFMSHRRCFKCDDSDLVSENARLALVLLTALVCLLLLSLCVAFLSTVRLVHLVGAFLLLQRFALAGQAAVDNLPANREEATALFAWLSLVSMDLEVARAGCGGLPELTFLRRLLMTIGLMVLTVVLFGLACLLPLCIRLRHYLPRRQRAYMDMLTWSEGLPAAAGASPPSPFDGCASAVGEEPMAVAWGNMLERIRQSWHIAAALFYLKLTSLSLQAFDVTRVPSTADADVAAQADPTVLVPTCYVLTADYQTVAYSAPHVVAMLLALLILAVLTLAWPLYSAALLLREFGHSHMRGVGGWMYRRLRLLRPTLGSEIDKAAHERVCQYIDAHDGLLFPTDANSGVGADGQEAAPRKDTKAAARRRRLHAAAFEYQSRLLASHGFLFHGVKPSCVLFTVQRSYVQGLQAALAVFVTSTSLSVSGCNVSAQLQLFLLGLLSALEALSIAVWLPHQSFRGSIFHASLRLAHVGYVALMMGITQCDMQLFPTMLALFGFILLLLITRRCGLPCCRDGMSHIVRAVQSSDSSGCESEERENGRSPRNQQLSARQSRSQKDTDKKPSPRRDGADLAAGADRTHEQQQQRNSSDSDSRHALRIVTPPGALRPDDAAGAPGTDSHLVLSESPTFLVSPSVASASHVFTGIKVAPSPSAADESAGDATELRSPHLRTSSAFAMDSGALTHSEQRHRAKLKANHLAAPAGSAAPVTASYQVQMSILAAKRALHFHAGNLRPMRLPTLNVPKRMSLIHPGANGAMMQLPIADQDEAADADADGADPDADADANAAGVADIDAVLPLANLAARAAAHAGAAMDHLTPSS